MEKVSIHEESRFRRIHCFLSQLPGILILQTISIIACTQLSDKFIWSFFCFPCIAPYFYLIRRFGWNTPDWQREHRRIFMTLMGLVFFLPMFILTYSIVWDPILSIKWYKSSSCTITGQFTTRLGNLERYTLQYVRLNNDFIGLSCVSDQKTSPNLMKGYDFYLRGEYYQCDPSYSTDDGNSIDYDNAGYNDSDNYRVLDSEKVVAPKRSSSMQRRCRTPYMFSAVKIPSWLCQTVEENNRMIEQDNSKEIATERSCYFSYYGDKQTARDNGKRSEHLLDDVDFVIVRMDEELYYSELCFIFLIVFGLYPAVLCTAQAPSSCLLYIAIEFFYSEEIAQENAVFEMEGRGPPSVIKDQSSKAEQTSATERKKQRLEMDQIVQVLSPNSKLNDRDFYDIYRDTRRMTARNFPEQSCDYGNGNNNITNLRTEAIGNVTSMVSNQTKSVFLDHQKDEKSFKDLDELNQQRRINESTVADEDDDPNDSESLDQDSSYIKIRKIFKRKMNPAYQKEQRIKRKAGIQDDNEEITLMKELRELSGLAAPQQSSVAIPAVDTEEIIKPEVTIQENKQNCENKDQVDDGAVVDLANGVDGNEHIQKSCSNNNSRNHADQEKEEEDEETTQNVGVETAQKVVVESSDDPEVKALEEMYGKYADKVAEEDEKRIDSQAIDEQLLE